MLRTSEPIRLEAMKDCTYSGAVYSFSLFQDERSLSGVNGFPNAFLIANNSRRKRMHVVLNRRSTRQNPLIVWSLEFLRMSFSLVGLLHFLWVAAHSRGKNNYLKSLRRFMVKFI